jgi:hypothetical protein
LTDFALWVTLVHAPDVLVLMGGAPADEWPTLTTSMVAEGVDQRKVQYVPLMRVGSRMPGRREWESAGIALASLVLHLDDWTRWCKRSDGLNPKASVKYAFGFRRFLMLHPPPDLDVADLWLCMRQYLLAGGVAPYPHSAPQSSRYTYSLTISKGSILHGGGGGGAEADGGKGGSRGRKGKAGAAADRRLRSESPIAAASPVQSPCDSPVRQNQQQQPQQQQQPLQRQPSPRKTQQTQQRQQQQHPRDVVVNDQIHLDSQLLSADEDDDGTPPESKRIKWSA